MDAMVLIASLVLTDEITEDEAARLWTLLKGYPECSEPLQLVRQVRHWLEFVRHDA